jgi:hypothetical protein
VALGALKKLEALHIRLRAANNSLDYYLSFFSTLSSSISFSGSPQISRAELVGARSVLHY